MLDALAMHLAKQDELRSLEAVRINSLVVRDMDTAERLHADVHELIAPRGVALSRTEYLRSIASGKLSYQRFEAVSEMQVLGGDGLLAVLRYKSAIDVESGSGSGVWSAICWHTDCYRRHPKLGWQAVWSQATAIDDGGSQLRA